MISVPDEVCKVVDEYQATLPKKRGWKSVKVKVRIGFYDRETSVFMGKQGYVFPVKKEARKELRVKDGDEVLVNLELL